MRVINTIFFFVLIVSSINSVAQNTSVALHQDKRILALCSVKDSLNSFPICLLQGCKKIRGYRILVATTDDRDFAYQLKSNLYERYSDQYVYMSYQTLFFKLKLGDFVSKDSAEAFSQMLNQELNISTSVIADMVCASNEEKALVQPCTETIPFPGYL